MKKSVCLLLCLALCLSLCSCRSTDYQRATQLIAEGKQEEAVPLLRELGDYRDSRQLLYGLLDARLEEALARRDFALTADLLWPEEDAYRAHAADAVRDCLTGFLKDFDFSSQASIDAGYARNAAEAAGLEDAVRSALDAITEHQDGFWVWEAYDATLRRYGAAFSEQYDLAVAGLAKGDREQACRAGEALVTIGNEINGIGDANAQEMCAQILRIAEAVLVTANGENDAAGELIAAKKEYDALRASYETEYARPREVVEALIGLCG